MLSKQSLDRVVSYSCTYLMSSGARVFRPACLEHLGAHGQVEQVALRCLFLCVCVGWAFQRVASFGFPFRIMD